MMDYRAAQRYSRALFNLASGKNLLDDVAADFLAVRQMIEKHPEISHLVSNSTIAQSEKEDFLEKVMPAHIARLLVDFLKVLMKKRRFRELAAIQEMFHKLYEKHKGIQKVGVISAVELSGAVLDRIRTVLEKKLNLYVHLVPEVDPAMIGGLVLQLEDKEINASFRERLRELKQRLMA